MDAKNPQRLFKNKDNVMLTKTRIISISLCVVSLSGCMIDGTNDGGYRHDYPSYEYQPSPLYPESSDNVSYYGPPEASKNNIVVPESYHVGAVHSPTASKDVDRSWVSSQNPQSYTIEIADGEKASQVAGKLQKAPKNERMAEVKYQRGGKAYYKGLYGSYPSYDAAQQALSALPEEVKQSAGIKAWGNIQNNISE